MMIIVIISIIISIILIVRIGGIYGIRKIGGNIAVTNF